MGVVLLFLIKRKNNFNNIINKHVATIPEGHVATIPDWTYERLLALFPGGARREGRDVLWESEHKTTFHRLYLAQRVDRNLLLSLYEQKGQILQLRLNLCGYIQDEHKQVEINHPALVFGLKIMIKLSEKYARDEISKDDLKNARTVELQNLGINPNGRGVQAHEQTPTETTAADAHEEIPAQKIPAPEEVPEKRKRLRSKQSDEMTPAPRAELPSAPEASAPPIAMAVEEAAIDVDSQAPEPEKKTKAKAKAKSKSEPERATTTPTTEALAAEAPARQEPSPMTPPESLLNFGFAFQSMWGLSRHGNRHGE